MGAAARVCFRRILISFKLFKHRSRKKTMRNLSDVTIGIKTFLRDPQLFAALSGIRDTMPDASVIVADDGEISEAKNDIHSLYKLTHIVCPFDSGFGFKSNIIAYDFKTKYLLVASDDFSFDSLSVRYGIEQLVEVLDYTDVDIVSGRVDNNRYEFYLQDDGDTITEIPVAWDCDIKPWFIECDLTVNYTLVKRHVFQKVWWDDDVKIGGGEHGSFFLDCKRAGFKTAYVPGVNINSQKVRDSNRYRQYRARANSSERPCFVKRGIAKYTLGNGQVDFDATVVSN